LHSSRFVTGVK